MNNESETFPISKPSDLTPIKKKINPKRLFILLLVIVAALGLSGTYYFYNQYKAIKENPDLEAQREIETLIVVVGNLMELPTDETPTVATIMDKEKLKDQPFFAKAENGDKLLTFTKALQAILYRPSSNKIINVAPIVINTEGQDISGAGADE